MENSTFINQFNYQNFNDEEREIFISLLSSEIAKKNDFFEKKLGELEIYSNEYIKTYIYYYLRETNFDNKSVNKLLNKTQTIYEMNNVYRNDTKEDTLFNMISNDEFKSNMVEDYEDKEITIENKIEAFFHSYFKIDEKDKDKEEIFIYLDRMTEKEYDDFINIFKLSFNLNYNLDGFLTKLTAIFFENKYILKINILQDVMKRIMNDNKLTTSFKKYILGSIITFMTKDEDVEEEE